MRILLSEGSSTSAREAITALGLKGHEIHVCDPDPRCLGRFSRFVHRFHRCPGLGVDPEGYLTFIVEMLNRRRFDVLLPIHEQGYLFARAIDRLRPHVSIALPTFESYERALGKVSFSRLLAELGLPQPATQYAQGPEMPAVQRYPVVLKADIGTASRGVWVADDEGGLRQALKDMEQAHGFERPFLAQEFVGGTIEHAQAVFDRGRLVASHAYRQIARGAGGGDAIKESIAHASIRADLARIGAALAWHGALSVDCIVEPASGRPLFIDCNPRLVEPMSAWFAGLDLVGLLLRVSLGERPEAPLEARAGVRTHLSMQSLLGAALGGARRRELVGECWRLLAKRGPYAGSREELTPVRIDWRSALPAAVTAAWLLANPRAAHALPRRGWGAHLLTPESVRRISDLDDGVSQINRAGDGGWAALRPAQGRAQGE